VDRFNNTDKQTEQLRSVYENSKSENIEPVDREEIVNAIREGQETIVIRRNNVMSQIARTLLAAAVAALTSNGLAQLPGDTTTQIQSSSSIKPVSSKATGEVEIVWPGGKGRMPQPGEDKLAFAVFEAFPANVSQPLPRGEFSYLVMNPDMTPHRQIVAQLIQVTIDPAISKAYFVGMVVSDVKSCGGGGSTHDSGCDGGCSGGEDEGHDGGCSGGGMEGGGSQDTGGCSDSGDTSTEPGCTGSEGSSDLAGAVSEGSTHEEGCAGGGSPMPGGSVSGRGSRVGQVIVIKVHDGGTPAINGDGITWKWFAPPTTPAELEAWVNRDLVNNCPHLCKKTIIGGNLIVHQ
jgi:hypothetical protein